MLKERLPLQRELFGDELVDNRSNAQKRRAHKSDACQQIQMFRTPEMVQVEGRKPNVYREWVNQAQVFPLVLESPDVSDDEVLEQKRQREAEALTVPMFSESSPLPSLPKSGVIFDADPMIQRGLRAKLRRNSLKSVVR